MIIRNMDVVFVVQLLSHVRLFATPWAAACQASLSFTVFQSLLRFTSIELVKLSNHLILCCPILLLPSVFPSLTVLSSESPLSIRWPKYWSFSISLSTEYSELISFNIDWFDLLAVQGTLKSLLQHRSSKASILRCSAFYGPTLTSIHDCWKNHSFTYTGLCWQSNFSAFLICCLGLSFLPRSKRLLISWLQSPSAVILEPKKIMSVTVYVVSTSVCHEVMGPDAMIFVFWMLSFKPTVSFPLSPSSRGSLVLLHFLP